MCHLPHTIIFCTCATGNYRELPHYWVLHRFNRQKEEDLVGEPMFPEYQFNSHYGDNQQTLLQRLNQPDTFDKPIAFRAKDHLKVVVNNLASSKKDRMLFYFAYKKGRWTISDHDGFTLTNRFDEVDGGEVQEATGNSTEAASTAN